MAELRGTRVALVKENAVGREGRVDIGFLVDMEKKTSESQLESPFQFHELFFSKTDLKGIMVSGNAVFQRVSEFPWDDLIQKPHNIIRHPDMPRAVFYLLWDYLKQGKPVGAFVKNKSKTGKYYWVFALAMPVEGGYLSVRVKPGGNIFSAIQKEYQKHLALERTENLTPQESCARLGARIHELGFADYSHFMTEALIEQLSHRAKMLEKQPSKNLAIMVELKQRGQSVAETTKMVLSAFGASKFVPLNLEIFSRRKGPDGAQVAVVASQYQKASNEIAEKIRQFQLMSDEVVAQISKSQFLVGASELLREVSVYVKGEELSKSNFKELEILATNYLSLAIESVRRVLAVIKEFISICESLRTAGLGLELVRITGKIELARMENSLDASALLDSLKIFQHALTKGVNEILEHDTFLDEQSRNLLRSLSLSTQ